jgi:hypothetical protein
MSGLDQLDALETGILILVILFALVLFNLRWR